MIEVEIIGTIVIEQIYNNEWFLGESLDEEYKNLVLNQLKNGDLYFSIIDNTLLDIKTMKSIYWCVCSAGDDLEYSWQ